MIAKLAIGLLIGYGVVVVACTVMQRSLMYFPGGPLPEPRAAGFADMRVVTLNTTDGLALTSWYAPARSGRATIVYFQGNAGNISHRLRKMLRFVEVGYGVLMVGYRGYGGNPGSPAEEGLLADGRSALRFLAEAGVPGEETVLIGESLGSGVAVTLAGETMVGAVILEAPFTSAADAGQRAYPFLPVNWLIFDRFDSLARIGKITAPLLIIHGENDNVVPVDLGRRLFAAANEPKEGHFLSGAGHNDLTEFGLIDIELSFLDRQFGER